MKFDFKNKENFSLGKFSNPGLIVVGLVILLAGASIYFFQASNKVFSDINTDTYQAVFLSNSQVYFGKIKSSNENYIELVDIYYLKDKGVGLESEPDLSLVKLGNELHGPENRMQINRDHVLFIEDLRADSKVVKAIGGYGGGSY